MQEARKGPVSISLGKPGGDGEGIMLIAGAVGAGVASSPREAVQWWLSRTTPTGIRFGVPH